MRCDVNVSISKTEKLGTRAEIKNIGSISNIGLAIQKEVERQQEIYENGGTIQEETRRFDEKKGKTVLMRVKETGNDYRYFPEPDIPYVVLTEEEIESVKKTIPILPNVRRDFYKAHGMSDINSDKLIQNRPLSDYLLKAKENLDYVIASNLLLGDISAYLNKEHKEIEETMLTIEKFESLVDKLASKEITSKIEKEILVDLLEKPMSVEEALKEHHLTLVNDTKVLEEIVTNIIKQNQESVQDYKNGKDRALKYLMGQIMKETKGTANPVLVNELLIHLLNEE